MPTRIRPARWFFLLALAPACAWPIEILELRDFRLIDGTGAPARYVSRMVARAGTIVSIDDQGEAPAVSPDDQWRTLDLAGAWVMPGLVDTHVHVGRFPDARMRAEQILENAARRGVTAVLDLGGDARALADIERALVAGEISGPTLVYSALFAGPAVFADGHMGQLSRGRTTGTAPWAQALAGNESSDRIALAVARAAGSGAGNLKLYGNLAPGLAGQVIAEAERQGLRTTAHATVFPARPGDLVEAGIDILSHAPYLVWEAVDAVPDDYGARTAGPWDQVPPDHPALLRLYRRMAERGVALDATLFIYRRMRDYSPMVQADWSAAAFAWGAQAVRHAHAAGVMVTTGTDWFEPRDEDGLPNTHEELRLLVEHAGFSPMQAIVAGTGNGARAIGEGERRGTLEVGRMADLLVLEASPLEDIGNTTRIRMAIKHGRVLHPSE
jgi:imidazolonepropionase-like amidohydrolase